MLPVYPNIMESIPERDARYETGHSGCSLFDLRSHRKGGTTAT